MRQRFRALAAGYASVRLADAKLGMTESAKSVGAKCRGRSDQDDKVGLTEVDKSVRPSSSDRSDQVRLVGLTEIAREVGRSPAEGREDDAGNSASHFSRKVGIPLRRRP